MIRELAACGLASAALLAAAARAEPPDFEREIAPLLVNHCLACHQPTKRSGELNLATRAALVAGGEQGPAIAPGQPDKSLLIERIAAGEMPPADAKEVKPVSPAELGKLWEWIAAGANWPEGRELGIHEQTVDLAEARSFWSYQPVRRPPVPTLGGEMATRHPIDAFVDQRLRISGLERSPRAEPAVLLRRVSLDLRGLPPTIAEQEEFLNAAAPDAYERLVDRLLSDPAHGERWARHWLDLVRYADSNGYERDGAKPSVWRYRDYVIDAWNRDKPYDRFIIEQLAGDELDQPSHETLIATGFHALGAWQDEVDPLEAPQYRADELDDMVRTTSQTFLGITLGCARCHNHKFDPLTMVDYYSLVAVLAPLKRPNQGRLDRDLPLGSPQEIAALHARDEELTKLQKQIALLEKQQPVDAQQQIATLREQQRDLRGETPDLPAAYRCFEDSADTPPVFLLLSGRASNPGPLVQPQIPGVLTALQPEFPQPTGTSTLRRQTLAQWIASDDNPLTARVIVNRVWQHHFGRGLVATPSDFGHMGARPSHPELLDWLAHWFMHDAGWSLKQLHRLILTSEAYRQTSIAEWRTRNAESQAAGVAATSRSSIRGPNSIDPENHLLWHFPYRRLDVETIRDSMLVAAGNLDRHMHGPAVFLPVPAVVIEAHTDKEAAWKVSTEPAINRRTIYAFVKRTLLVPLLETLDFCDTTNSTELRATTNVAPQALTLFNGEFVTRQAEHFAQRLEHEAGRDAGRQIQMAYRLALARPATQSEADALHKFIQQEAAATDFHRAVVQACRVILNLNEFVYPN